MTKEKLEQVAGLATTARMAVDLHGEFYMIYPQYFDIAEKWHSYIPNATSNGSTAAPFLDFGILPFGKGKEMHLTINEMRVVMTLWCLVRSPLIYGGAVAGSKAVDPQILSIVTNTDMLRIADDVQQPTLLPSSQHEHIIIWMAFSASDPATMRYVAVFNLGQKTQKERAKTRNVDSLHLPSSSCRGATFQNDTCFHNPRGKMFGLGVNDVASCCEACKNYTKARCMAWSAFRDHGSLQCFLFGSVGKVNRVSGCIFAGTDSPAPAPVPFSGENMSLSALKLNESQAWTVRSIWGPPTFPTRVTNGTFVSFPSYHDVDMYVVSAH
eukprot:SAG11_NODE_996_length_6253_cov_3.652909_5_plen_325_part_00